MNPDVFVTPDIFCNSANRQQYHHYTQDSSETTIHALEGINLLKEQLHHTLNQRGPGNTLVLSSSLKGTYQAHIQLHTCFGGLY